MKSRTSLNPLRALIVLGALTLITGCTGTTESGEASPPPSAPSPASPSPSPSPTPTTETPIAPAGVIPEDCRDLIDTRTAISYFGDIPLNDPALGLPASGAIEPVQPPEDADAIEILLASTELQCVWQDPRADISGLSARIGRVDLAVAEPFAQGLPAEGYACSEEYEGVMCRLVQENDRYPVEEGRTYFLRDDISIYVVQTALPTDGLMGEFVARIWS